MTGEILSVAEMYAADAYAAAHGVRSLDLMEAAGAAVAHAVHSRWPGARVTVLCGPGNNGGDGFVAARHLAGQGHAVTLALLGDRTALRGDAAAMAARWDGAVAALTPDVLANAGVVIDAIFGAGLSRPLDAAAAAVVAALNVSGLPLVAVDVPSGLSGDLGHPLGEVCVRATHTVTFFRKKPAHVLTPGRILCGEVEVADIGIPGNGLPSSSLFENTPALWLQRIPRPNPLGHKYGRGHVLAVSGPMHATGAARLAARAALRAGAGLVSVASPPDAVAINAAQLTAIMVKPFDGPEGLAACLADPRFNSAIIGPGCGVGEGTKSLVGAVLRSRAAAVLDADALTSFAGEPGTLLLQLRPDCVLTPHEGEFERLFPGLLKGLPTRIEAAREAAAQAGCVMVLKGPDTVIAAPDGRAAVNTNAPPTLATAGSGDVLAGIVAGLVAQGMDAFGAACAGAWLHGEAANLFGRGLIAEDIPEMLPRVLAAMAAGAA